MPLSKVRQIGGASEGPAEHKAEPDMVVYEVFTRQKWGEPHVHAGSLHAADDDMALSLACEHYGRDQPCVHVWVCRRDHLFGVGEAERVIWRTTDQSYRLARGYQDVRKKWEQFREKKQVDEYQKEDIKEHF